MCLLHEPASGVRGTASFLLAKVTPDCALINGATFTGTVVRHFDICKSFV